jgi:Uma2 family endonuclease
MVKPFLSVEEYLKLEANSETRHEYVDGALVSMAGETLRHDDIVLNVVEALRPTARIKGCRLHATSIQAKVSPTRYRYPDVVITCEQPAHEHLIERPCFLLEVISDATAETDTGKKLEEYTGIPSLEVYAVVWQKEPRVVVYKRHAEGWQVEVLSSQGQIEVGCLRVALRLEAIYQGIEFNP